MFSLQESCVHIMLSLQVLESDKHVPKEHRSFMVQYSPSSQEFVSSFVAVHEKFVHLSSVQGFLSSHCKSEVQVRRVATVRKRYG